MILPKLRYEALKTYRKVLKVKKINTNITKEKLFSADKIEIIKKRVETERE